MPIDDDYPDLPHYERYGGNNLPPPPVTQTPQLPPPPRTLPQSNSTSASTNKVTRNMNTRTTKTRNISCSYNLVVIIASIIFIVVQLCLIIVFAIFISLNNGNGGLYTLMIFNMIFSGISIIVGIFNIVSNISIIDCMKDCLRPVQYILFLTALIALCVLAVCSLILNAFIFIYHNIQSMLVMASVVICTNFIVFLIMTILAGINVGWLKCQLNRA